MWKSQEQLIAEIHSEFDTAQERLLQQANEMLNATVDKREAEVSERLRKVGFFNVPLVKKVETKQKQIVTSKSQAELIQYYKFTYPFLKFLTEEELDRICEKYKLIHAPVKNYVKEVPEKNLRDIEQAQAVKEGDEWDWVEANRKREEKKILEAMSREQRRMYYPTIGLNWGFGRQQSKEGLFIAAPESHFDLNGLAKTSKFGYRTKVKDPIVFRYVRGGIQILTKWGVEGEDQSLVVEKLN